MADLLNDVVAYLVTQSVGTLGTNLFKGYLPPTPDTAIAVIETGGPEPDHYLPTRAPTFQVMIRAADYATGKTKLAAVRAALHRNDNIALVSGQTYFYYIQAISEGGHLGRDDNGRDLFSINFLCKTR